MIYVFTGTLKVVELYKGKGGSKRLS